MASGARPANTRTIRVFVSSTFRDMQEERDELVKHVFPKLRKRCAERGVTWGDVDLRWGIPDEEKGEVLSTCLAEIERCRPYFIGLLGERYGWVPESDWRRPGRGTWVAPGVSRPVRHRAGDREGGAREPRHGEPRLLLPARSRLRRHGSRGRTGRTARAALCRGDRATRCRGGRAPGWGAPAEARRPEGADSRQRGPRPRRLPRPESPRGARPRRSQRRHRPALPGGLRAGSPRA